MLSLGYITTNTPYYTAQLHDIYTANQASVDAIYNDPYQRDLVIQAYLPLLSQVIIIDPNVNW